MIDALRAVVADNGIIVEGSSDTVPGLIFAYKRGYLQAEMIDEECTVYSFPSMLHQR